MYIDILRVHNDSREKRSSSDTLGGVVKMRENNTWRRESFCSVQATSMFAPGFIDITMD